MTVMQSRFARDTAKHEMTVLHSNGLYRHLRFMQPGNSAYWFDLITWPGCLTIRGDLNDSYNFSRLPDMFEFFRGKQIDPHYWAQKLDAGRDSAKEYSEDLFRQLVTEHVADAIRYSDAPRGIGKAVRAEILDQDLTEETEARALLEDFEFQGFEFHDVWEWDFKDFDWSFLWACHAIQWGIDQYDRATAADRPCGCSARFERHADGCPMADTAASLTNEQLADISYRGARPSQYTAATIRQDYADMLAEVRHLRTELGQAEDLAVHNRGENELLRTENARLRAAASA